MARSAVITHFSFFDRVCTLTHIEMRYPYVVDLFSGAGGFSLGAHLAGFRTVLSVERDADLASSYSSNFPGSQLMLRDIRSLRPLEAIRRAGISIEQVAGVVGGPPCQGYSLQGKRDPEDPRNSLVGDFFRFVEAIRPAFFVMENVPGMLTESHIELLKRRLRRIGNAFEIVGPLAVDAAELGAATHRRRAIVFGYQPGEFQPIDEVDIKRLKTRFVTVREAIHDLPAPSSSDQGGAAHYVGEPRNGFAGEYARRARRMPPEGLAAPDVRSIWANGIVTGVSFTNHSSTVVRRFRRIPPGSKDPVSWFPRLHWDDACPTLLAGTGKDRGSFQAIRPIHPDEPRVITVREAARLQGFPDWFQFHKTKWHSFRMIGNSISPYVAHALLALIRSRMKR